VRGGTRKSRSIFLTDKALELINPSVFQIKAGEYASPLEYATDHRTFKQNGAPGSSVSPEFIENLQHSQELLRSDGTTAPNGARSWEKIQSWVGSGYLPRALIEQPAFANGALINLVNLIYFAWAEKKDKGELRRAMLVAGLALAFHKVMKTEPILSVLLGVIVILSLIWAKPLTGPHK
jgi:hypothetical protein